MRLSLYSAVASVNLMVDAVVRTLLFLLFFDTLLSCLHDPQTTVETLSAAGKVSMHECLRSGYPYL